MSALPVEGCARREPQLAVQEVEQARVAELDPATFAVEVGEGDEEVGQGAVLAAEQLGEALREISRVVHDGECRTRFRALAKRTQRLTGASSVDESRKRVRSGCAPASGLLALRERAFWRVSRSRSGICASGRQEQSWNNSHSQSGWAASGEIPQRQGRPSPQPFYEGHAVKAPV